MQGIFHLGWLFICPSAYGLRPTVCGLRSAPYIFTLLMDLFTWICIKTIASFNLGPYVDDFIYAVLPNDIWRSFPNSRFGSPLRRAFQESNFVEPTPTIEYVGFLVDAPSMAISLPQTSWIASCRAADEAHVIQVLLDGKIFCDRLISFARS